MLANAKGLTLERKAPPGGPKGPDYLRINPISKVPAASEALSAMDAALTAYNQR